jgi:hypothetical protein
VTHGTVPNVVVFNGNGFAIAKTEVEISQIVGHFIEAESLDNPSWEYSDKGYIWNQELKVKNIKIDVNRTMIETGDLTAEFLLDRQIMVGTTPFTIVFNFEYDAKIGVRARTSGNGTLVYTSTAFSFTKQEIRKDSTNGVNATVDLTFNYTYTYLPESDNPFLKEYFFKLFSQNAVDFIDHLDSDFQKLTNKFYESHENSSNTNFLLPVTNPNTTYEVDLLYLENPKYEAKGITYYHCGEVSNVVAKNGFLTAPKLNQSKWDNFSSTDGSFQVFLGHHVLSELVADVSESKSFKFNVDSTGLPPNSGFLLNIESLGSIAPSFYNYFARDQQLTVNGQLSQMALDIDGEELVGRFTLTMTLYSGTKAIFMYDTLVNYHLIIFYDVNTQTFNLRVDPALEMTDMTLMNLDSKLPYGNVDVHQLKSWTINTIDDHLAKNKFFIFREHVDFSKIFIKSKIIVIPGQGIVIAGEASLPYESAAPENFVANLFKSLKMNLNK